MFYSQFAERVYCVLTNSENITWHFLVIFQTVSYLVKVSDGDLRKAITYLQSATRLMGGKEITEKTVTEIAGVSFVLQLLL